ncbi:FKBP-type peptidyl-prolyl cis-trans isomerase [Gordonia humi]|uniref:Peptidyl-prolyl cis-trans isomerase n=1 Tax=Gordonia humi TaxID=686429 RepID=A0A840F3A3_9ACTN|nr:FKBP-type peptidyl-prolyl cis-trans isomerase [Gordonia humi]MBB4136963.1 hypothetical protein [Gordonia humi]
MKLKPLILVPAAVAALALAGCSSDDSPKAEEGCPPVPAEYKANPTWQVEGTSGCAVFTVTDDAKNQAPLIEIATPFSVDETQVKTLIAGKGPKVAEDSNVNVFYEGVNGTTESVFDSAYERGEPTAFQPKGVVKGFKQALVGQNVGSTVAVVIPPKDGYGEEGGGDGYIGGEDTIVFAVKIMGLAAAPAPAQAGQ